MPEDNPLQTTLARVNERLDYLEYALREQIARLYAIEQKLGLTPPPIELKRAPVAPPAAETPPSPPPIDPITLPLPPTARPPIAERAERSADRTIPAEPPPVAPSSPAAPAAAQAAQEKPPLDLEALIGGTWFNRIGIVAIILAVGYFLREAINRGWIGPTGRVLIGISVGLGLVIAGERIRARGYRSYAQSLSGGGIAVLYLVFFAAFARYGLIGQGPAFLFMSLVTTLAVLLAARYDALAIAILGLFGGFLTPVLLSTGQDNEAGLFTYVALLDAGVLALAYFKQWRTLNYLAFSATVMMSGAWMTEWYAPEKLWLTIFFFTLFFLIFAALAIFHNVVNRRPTKSLDLGLIFTNASIYFATCYGLLSTDYRPYLGLFAVLMSGFYLGLGYLTYGRDRQDRYLILTFIGLATIFLTLAIPIQLNQHWVTMGWGLEGAVLSWIGLKAENRPTRYTAVLIFSFALLHWFAIDLHDFAFITGGTFVPILNRRGFSALILIASLAITTRLYRRAGQTVGEEERNGIAVICTMAANLLALVWLSTDVRDYFNQAISRTDQSAATEWERLQSSRQFSLSALWTIYGFMALAVGVLRRVTLLRWGALALLSLSIFKVLTVDARLYAAPWHTPVFNQTFFAFALLVASLAAGAWFYARAEGLARNERTAGLALLIAAANLMAVIGLSVEASGYFDAQLSPETRPQLEESKQFALTALWSIYSTAALIIGFKRRAKMVHLGALMLLALTAVKVLVVDLGFNAAPWHTLIWNQSFGGCLLLIAALGCGLHFYSRAEDLDPKLRRSVVQILTIAANLLGIIALSFEARGRFESQIYTGQPTPDQLQELMLAKELSLSIIWAVYGGALLVAGIWRNNRLLRIMALMLLTITTAKVFLNDLAALDKIYRIVSFIVLGAILLTVSFLYQQWQRRISEERR